jgi:hypothetical protein
VNPSNAITLESVTETPVAQFYASSNCNATSWIADVGSDTLAGSGTTKQVGVWGPFVNTILSLNAATYTSAGTSIGDIGTEDFVMEICFRMPVNTTDRTLISKRTGAGAGWVLSQVSAVPTFTIYDGTNSASTSLASNVAAGQWCHMLIFCDKSSPGADGLRMYINGSKDATPGDASTVATLSNSTNLIVGHGSTDFGIGSLIIWKRASWLNGTSYDTVATNRFHAVMGYYHASSTATVTAGNIAATGDAYDPTTQTRRLFQVGSNWIPCRIAPDGAYSWAHLQLRQVVAASNEDYSGWTVDDSVVISDAILGPDGITMADGIAPDSAVSGTCGIIVSSPSGSSANNVIQAWIKKGSRGFAWINYETAAYGSNYAIINLSTGAIATTDPTRTTAYVEDWGDINGDGANWYRYVGYGASGSGAVFRLGVCDTGTALTCANGDNVTPGIYVWGAAAFTNSLSNVVTTDPPWFRSTNTTRTLDTLSFSVTSADPLGDAIGSVWVDYETTQGTILGTTTPLIIDNASSTTNNITMTQQTNGVVTLVVTDGVGGTGSTESTTAMNDGDRHELRLKYDEDSGCALKVDGSEEATDASVAAPSDLNRVRVTKGIGDIRLFRNRQY